MRKPRAYAEIYNDLDDDVVNLFQVLRSKSAEVLIEQLRLTPFSRLEFNGAYLRSDCPIERSRHLIIRAFMGFGSNGHNSRIKTGFRANSNRAGTTPAHDWINYPDCLGAIVQRLKGVTIEHRDAVDVMSQHDGYETLHYVDPPYVPETRNPGHDYNHELTDQDHLDLLAFLKTLEGMVVLSGYPNKMYDKSLNGWKRIERKALADGARERIEVLWINPAASRKLNIPKTQDLFDPSGSDALSEYANRQQVDRDMCDNAVSSVNGSAEDE
jgi:DNA adenine methylase